MNDAESQRMANKAMEAAYRATEVATQLAEKYQHLKDEVLHAYALTFAKEIPGNKNARKVLETVMWKTGGNEEGKSRGDWTRGLRELGKSTCVEMMKVRREERLRVNSQYGKFAQGEYPRTEETPFGHHVHLGHVKEMDAVSAYPPEAVQMFRRQVFLMPGESINAAVSRTMQSVFEEMGGVVVPMQPGEEFPGMVPDGSGGSTFRKAQKP